MPFRWAVEANHLLFLQLLNTLPTDSNLLAHYIHEQIETIIPLLTARPTLREIVKALLDTVMDIDTQKTQLPTALRAATLPGDHGIAKLLLERSPDVSLADVDGLSPLYQTARFERDEAARPLLDRGVDSPTIDDKGEIPLNYATEIRRLAWVSLNDSKMLIWKDYVEVTRLLSARGKQHATSRSDAFDEG
ncbi:ankyrin [Glonium stellatum]|uniref:Ankyrin n=1 Tax=Glonium stellatum TaxID=574774 RepID=A0A8E2F0B7_9PEZI|nr:ankyrin [Glonium stellatum]